MACNCIDMAQEHLVQAGYFDATPSNLVHSLSSLPNIGSRWPGLVFKYNRRKADGMASVRTAKVTVHCSYCPICGKRY